MAAEAQTVTAPGTISPKVFWPLLVGVGLTFVAAFLSALTPEMLTWLGPMALPMAFALGTVSQTITAYMKSDELRDLGVKATAAVLPVQPTSSTTPQFDTVFASEDLTPHEGRHVSAGSTSTSPAAPIETSSDDAAARMRAELNAAGGVS